MAIPEITPSFSTPITGVGDLIIDPPSDPTSLGGGFDAGNLILGGEANVIQDSRRCTIINGASNFLEGKYNTHIIGDAVTPLSPFGPCGPVAPVAPVAPFVPSFPFCNTKFSTGFSRVPVNETAGLAP